MEIKRLRRSVWVPFPDALMWMNRDFVDAIRFYRRPRYGHTQYAFRRWKQAQNS